MTLPGPIRFVMSSQSHVHLANGTAPTDGGHSVLSARSLPAGRKAVGSEKLTSADPSKSPDSKQLCFPRIRFVGCLGLRPIQVTGLTFGRFGNLCANLTLPSLGIFRMDLQVPWFFLVPACLDKRLRIEQLVLPRKTPWFCHI